MCWWSENQTVEEKFYICSSKSATSLYHREILFGGSFRNFTCWLLWWIITMQKLEISLVFEILKYSEIVGLSSCKLSFQNWILWMDDGYSFAIVCHVIAYNDWYDLKHQNTDIWISVIWYMILLELNSAFAKVTSTNYVHDSWFINLFFAYSVFWQQL